MSSRTLKKRLQHWFHRRVDKIVRAGTHQRAMKNTIILICLFISAILGWLLYLEST